MDAKLKPLNTKKAKGHDRISNKIRWCSLISWGTTSSYVIINHGVPQGSPLSPILYLIFKHDLPPPTSKVFRSIFADDLKYVVAGPNLSIITANLQQSMDDLAVCANQWRIGMNAGKTSKLLFQRSTQYLPDWRITLHGRAIRSVTSAKFLGIIFETTLSLTKHFHAITNLAGHRLLKLLSISTSTHGPSPSTTIKLFNTYIRTLLEYGSAATCVANPSRFVQRERLQMRLITKTLDLPNTLNNDILRRHADQPTIHDRLLYLAQTLVHQSFRKQYSAARLCPQPHPLLYRETTTNTRRNTETVINLLFASGSLAATLTNYEIEKVKTK